MTCSGCSGAITRVLTKAKDAGEGEYPSGFSFPLPHLCVEGVSDFTVDLETQEVIVKGSAEYDDVLARIKKTGKEVSPS